MSQLDEIKRLTELLRDRNKKLDAMAWVWCDGGCETGVFRHVEVPNELTLEMVELAELNVKRMRTHYENQEFRKTWSGMSDTDKALWFKNRKRN